MDAMWPVVWALTPTIIVGVLFWFVFRAIIHADRKERSAYKRIEAEERARLALKQDEQ